MRYLKTYNEKVGVHLKSEIKTEVESYLISLTDEDFNIKVSHIDYYDSNLEKVKVQITRRKRFIWEDIKFEIEAICKLLKEDFGFNIEHFTQIEDWKNFAQKEDDFTLSRMSKGYVWGTDENGKIKSKEQEYQIRPTIAKTDTGEFIFQISFTKDNIEVDKTRVHLSTNEELKPQTYISAADKLTKLGHIKRPEQLRTWANIVKEREVDARKKRVLDEAKKLGEFGLRFERRGEIKVANFYLSLLFGSDWHYEMMSEWLDGERNTLYPQIMMGIHPIGEQDVEVLEWYFGEKVSNYINSYNGIIWLQDIYINLTTQNYKDEDGVKLPMTPSGIISIEGAEFSEVYFANRREAIKFRNLLVELFEGDIEYTQPNGKDFKEDILETWCEHDERPVELSELEDFIDKLRIVRLNSLYRD